VIAYDIVCDRRRTCLEKLASSVAERVQDMRIRGWLSTRSTDFLRRAEPLLDMQTDSVRV